MTINWVAYDRRINKSCGQGYVRNPYSKRCISVTGKTYKMMLERLKINGHHQQAENLLAGRRPALPKKTYVTMGMQTNSLVENNSSLRETIEAYQKEIYELKKQLQQRTGNNAVRQLKNDRLAYLEKYVEELENQSAFDATKIADSLVVTRNRNALKNHVQKTTDLLRNMQSNRNALKKRVESVEKNRNTRVTQLQSNRNALKNRVQSVEKNRNTRVTQFQQHLTRLEAEKNVLKTNRNTHAAAVTQLQQHIMRLEAEKNVLKTNNGSTTRIQQLEKQQQVLTNYLKAIDAGEKPNKSSARYFHPDKTLGSNELFQALSSITTKLKSGSVPSVNHTAEQRVREMIFEVQAMEKQLEEKDRELGNVKRKAELNIERIQRDSNMGSGSTAARKVKELSQELAMMKEALGSKQREVETLSRQHVPMTRQYTAIQEQLQQREEELYAARAELEEVTQIRREKEALERTIAESRKQVNAARAEANQAVRLAENKKQLERTLRELQDVIDHHQANARAARAALDESKVYTSQMMADKTRTYELKLEQVKAEYEAKIAELANAKAANATRQKRKRKRTNDQNRNTKVSKTQAGNISEKREAAKYATLYAEAAAKAAAMPALRRSQRSRHRPGWLHAFVNK